MQDNTEQIEFWNGEAGAKWVQQQQVMDRTLQAISDVLLQRADGQRGEVALDVGCGCGDTSLALARSGLKVTGVDISAPMLEHARGRVDTEDAQFVVADAASETFDQSFDLVLSRFGVMFFSDPTEAFANLRQSTQPKGRLCFVCWQPPALNAWVSLPMMAAKHLLPQTPPADPFAPGPFAFADAERSRSILSCAGWKDIEIEDIRWQMKMGEDANDAMRFATQIGPLAGALRELPENAHAEVLEKVLAALKPHETPAGVYLDAASWLVTAGA